MSKPIKRKWSPSELSPLSSPQQKKFKKSVDNNDNNINGFDNSANDINIPVKDIFNVFSDDDDSSSDDESVTFENDKKGNTAFSILARVNNLLPLCAVYLVMIKVNKFSVFIIEYFDSDIQKQVGSKLESALQAVIESGVRILFSAPLTEEPAKHGLPQQQRTIKLQLNTATDTTFSEISHRVLTSVNPFNLFSIENTLQSLGNNKYISFIGYCISSEILINYCIYRVHVLNQQMRISESVILAINGNDHNPQTLIPNGSIFIGLNVFCKFNTSSNSYRLWATYANIINISATNGQILDELQINSAKHQEFKRIGLINCRNNTNRPEWNARMSIENISIDLLNTMEQRKVLRISNVEIIGIGILPLADRCKMHRTLLQEGSCRACKRIPNELVINWKYNTHIRVADALGNEISVRPHWLLFNQVFGISIDEMREKYLEKHPTRCFHKKFEKKFLGLFTGKKFTLDFMVSDEYFAPTRLIPRQLFAVQIHPKNTIQNICYDKVYIKSFKYSRF